MTTAPTTTLALIALHALLSSNYLSPAFLPHHANQHDHPATAQQKLASLLAYIHAWCAAAGFAGWYYCHQVHDRQQSGPDLVLSPPADTAAAAAAAAAATAERTQHA